MKPTLRLISFSAKKLYLLPPLLLFHFFSMSQVAVDYGKSYVNLTKGLNGGTIETGDTLQVRATFVVRCSGGGCPSFVDSCAFYDTIKAGLAYIPGSLAVITNESKIYKAFTDVAGDDCGGISGSNIQINLGFNGAASPATAFRRGRIANNHKPSFFGATCIMVASYKVRVTAALGSLVNTGGGSVSYKPPTALTPLSVSFPTNNARVFTNYGICSNTVGANALGTEFNGTFGSGQPRNRGTSGSVPATYTYDVFTTNGPNDYFYGIANNTSTRTGYTTSNAWPKPDGAPNHRVFSVWDIIGDHTGAVSPTLGNPAADTVTNTNAGYMLVVNASYRIDSAFTHTISNLCPNTYYELSAWFRNICSKCGCDSNGKGASNTAGPVFYIPTDTVGTPDDSSGVYPNLTLRIDGIDYYTSGNIKYTARWIKKGFTYLTGPTQTSFTMTIRNNAPGGGGNDWAIDDITLATCTPNLTLVPSGGVNVCLGNQVDMFTTVRCFFPNYIYWTWERSTNGGVTWNPTGVSGTGSPVLVAGEWQYVATYPSFLADSSVHNNKFRIRVASTAANLSDPNCSFTASNTIIVWVNNCTNVLSTSLLAFDGRLVAANALLRWTSAQEDADLVYEIERSDNGTLYEKIGVVNATGSGTGASYTFTDAKAVTQATYYRIKLVTAKASKYSKIVMLYNQAFAIIRAVVNPFSERISFELATSATGIAHIRLFDSYGRLVKTMNQSIQRGVNKVDIDGLGGLSSGVYNLQVQLNEWLINKNVLRKSN